MKKALILVLLIISALAFSIEYANEENVEDVTLEDFLKIGKATETLKKDKEITFGEIKILEALNPQNEINRVFEMGHLNITVHTVEFYKPYLEVIIEISVTNKYTKDISFFKNDFFISSNNEIPSSTTHR